MDETVDNKSQEEQLSLHVPKQETKKLPQIIASLSAAGGAFAVGTALGWPSPASSRFGVGNDDNFSITVSEFDSAASIIFIGTLVSCLPIGFLMKKFGRKYTMLSLVVPFVVGWAMVIWAKSMTMLLIGRFLLGLAGGAFCISAPQYSSEVAEKEVRGLVGSFFQLLLVIGVLFIYTIGAFLQIATTGIICGCIPLLFGVIFFFMPESPVYLVQEGRDSDASKCLKWLRGKSYDPQYEIAELKADLAKRENSQVSLVEVLKKRATIRALIIGFGLQAFQQLGGINIVIIYVADIFKASNSTIDPDVQSIIVGAVHVAGTFISTAIVDKAGRKILLILSSLVMTLMLIALGVFFYLADNAPEQATSIEWLPLVSLCVYIAFFAFGFGPIPWMMISEVYTDEYNAIASPLSGSFNWSLAFIITLTFNPIKNAIGMGITFWGYSVLCFMGAVFTFFIVPETKGKSKAEVQRILSGEK